MSGHSKWHNIQARKGKQDALRSGNFTKVSRGITMAAKQGGGDPTMNFSLRLAIEKAKAVGMPKDNIERAVKRGTGELEGAVMEETLYEAYGPGGVAILVKTVSDNKNRTVSDVKYMLSMAGGSFGGAGSVMWMFQQLGVIEINKEQLTINKIDRDTFEMDLIEMGAEDISDEEELLIIKTKLPNFQKVLHKLKELNIEPKESGIQWIAKDKIAVTPEIEGKLENLFGAFEDNDDVSDYFTNAI